MKKIFLILGGGLLIVLVGVYLVGTFFLGSIVRSGVNQFGPKLTQTPVRLVEANISPLTGSGSLRGLSVDNPEGWSKGRAFYLGKVSIDVEPMSIFGDSIVINELLIDEPEFTYETKIVSSNIKDLLENIQDFTGKGGKAAETKEGKPIKFIVKKFRLTNGKATLGAGGAALPIPFPPVSMDNIGGADGITADQLAGELMRNVLGSIVAGTANALTQVGGTAGAAGLEKTKEAAKQAADSIKGFFKKEK
jgi:hypothetical protein